MTIPANKTGTGPSRFPVKGSIVVRLFGDNENDDGTPMTVEHLYDFLLNELDAAEIHAHIELRED